MTETSADKTREPAVSGSGDALLAADDAAWTMNEIRRRLAVEQSDETVKAREKRRHVSQKVREAREKLTSETGTRPAFDTELARLYAQNRHTAAYAIMALEIAVAVTMSLWLSIFTVTSWLAAVLIFHSLILWQVHRFLSPTAKPQPLRAWRQRFALAEFAHATTFAMIVPPLVLVENDSARIFLVFAMLLIVAIRTLLSASLPIVVYAGSLPITAAIAGFFLLMPDPALRMVAIIAPLAQIFFVLLGQRLFRTSLVTLQYRAEKDALIAELEQAKSNSDEARRRAEEANVAKSRFLATMSHELRTPLNAILGFSEVLKSEVFGAHINPTYKEYAGDIHSSGEHLLTLINELLDLSRIEAGRYELNEEAIPLINIVDDCRHLLKLRAKNRGITIRDEFEQGLPMLWADERAIRQITLNLLSNAIKFTPQGGEIVMRAGSLPNGGQFLSIRDTGPGIPEDEIPVVLSSFGQGTLAIKTAEQGAGLGLPIVQGLTDLHGGTFELKSKLREGTEVTVTFPSYRVVTALAPMSNDEPEPLIRRSA
jgi:two-component system cell cycle sensor histidine kinase PleC